MSKKRNSDASDARTRQVCTLVQRALSSALASNFDDPVLLGLCVERVVPAPTVARLLVVVAPLNAEDPTFDLGRSLDALDQVRGQLRSEVALELNRKRTPELSFTFAHPSLMLPTEPAVPRLQVPIVPAASDSALEPAARTRGVEAAGAPSGKQREFPAAAGPQVRAVKREAPRNQKRTARRAERRARRRQGDPAQGGAETTSLYEVHETSGVPVKHWTRGVPLEPAALQQLTNIAQLPIVHGWVAAMPDVHLGIGATVGSVIPTKGAIIPAAVGVDIGCGMNAVRTTLHARHLPDHLGEVRSVIEAAVPHGRGRGLGRADAGAWADVPNLVAHDWKELEPGFCRLVEKHPALRRANHAVHLGTLGTGNHFIELCLDETDQVWVLLHSGSRGVGNRIGRYFIELAKRDMEGHLGTLPDRDLAYFSEGSRHFDDYVEAVGWAQRYARNNRDLMMKAVIRALAAFPSLPAFVIDGLVVDCHHNYVAEEEHAGESVLVTRKGAVRAGPGELGIIPGSMGARSFIVRGKGSPHSFFSCSHGAGRRMSRTEARKRYTVSDHVRMTQGVECRKDESVLDETPAAYKDIGAVMAAQADLVEVVHTLRQVVCVKG